MDIFRKGDGDAIVFLHGVVGNQSVFKRQVDAFSDTFTTVSYDYIGHAKEERGIAKRCRVSDLVTQLKEVLDKEGVRRVHLCTLSFACYIAFAFAKQHPGRVLSICAVGGFLNHPSSLQRAFHVLWQDRYKPYDAWIKQYAEAVNPTEAPYGNLYTNESRAIFYRLGREIHPHVMRDILHEKCFYDVSTIVEAITCPCLFVMGEYDLFHMETLVQTKHAIQLLKGTPHVAHLFNETDFERLYRTFLHGHTS